MQCDVPGRVCQIGLSGLLDDSNENHLVFCRREGDSIMIMVHVEAW